MRWLGKISSRCLYFINNPFKVVVFINIFRRKSSHLLEIQFCTPYVEFCKKNQKYAGSIWFLVWWHTKRIPLFWCVFSYENVCFYWGVRAFLGLKNILCRDRLPQKKWTKNPQKSAEILARHSGRNSRERPRKRAISDGSTKTTWLVGNRWFDKGILNFSCLQKL